MSRSAERQPGRRDVPVWLQRQKAATSQPFSEAETEWETYSQAWAHFRPLYAREREFASRMEGTITHVLEIDTHPTLSVKHTDRIEMIESGRIMNIGGVIDENEQGRELRIFVTENLTAGAQ